MGAPKMLLIVCNQNPQWLGDMQDYMQAMANTLNGELANVAGETAHKYIDPKFVSVYRNNSATAFADVLRANYKTVEAVVGREYFSNLTQKYMQKYPCQHRTLVGYGADFISILEDNQSDHKLPYLASFAKLDRAWTQAHIALDTEHLTLESLVNSLGPEDNLLAQTVTPKPDVQIIKNPWPVFNIWEKLRDGDELGKTSEMEQKQENILLWRYENEITYKPLSNAELVFLESVFAQQTLGQASEISLGYNPNIDIDIDINQMLIGMINAQLFTPLTGENNA